MTQRLTPPVRLRVGERLMFVGRSLCGILRRIGEAHYAVTDRAGRWHGPFAMPRDAIEAMRRANLREAATR